MEISYELTERDYLNFQLYHTSTNPTVKKQRSTTQYVVVVITILVAIYFFIVGDMWAGGYFLAGAVPVYFLCGFYTKILYRFTLKNHVASIYRRTTPRPASLAVSTDELVYHEAGYVRHYKINDIEQVIDISDYFYLKFSETSYIIIPKYGLSDHRFVELKMKKIADEHNIQFVYNPKWKWR